MLKKITLENICKRHKCNLVKIKNNEFCELCNEEKIKNLKHKKKEKEILENIKKLKIPKRFKNKSIFNYKITNDKQKNIIKSVNSFIENYKKSTGLFMLGGNGCGKTHVSIAVLKELSKKNNFSGCYIDVFKLFREIKESWNNKNKEKESDIILKYSKYDLLIIDELGIQYKSTSEFIFLNEIINDRYSNEKPTILISNLNLEKIKALLGNNIIDRFREGGKVLTFNWDSYRKKKETTC